MGNNKEQVDADDYFNCRQCGAKIYIKGAYDPQRPIIGMKEAVFCINGNGNGVVSKCAKEFSMDHGPALFYSGMSEAPIHEIADAVEHAMREIPLRP